MKLEIIADSLESAQIAEKNGADRIELCEDLVEGGITPSYGLIELVKKNVSIDVYVMIRPRGGDFLFSDYEFQVMKRNVEICKSIGVEGIVIGMLHADGTIDKHRCAELIKLAGTMGVTFHRAFDNTSDYRQSLEDIIDIGAERILTSGQCKTAIEGIEILNEVHHLANNRIKIMAGAGVTSRNIAQLIQNTNLQEFHSSAKKLIQSNMKFRNEKLNMGRSSADEYSIYTIDGAEVRNIKTHLS